MGFVRIGLNATSSVFFKKDEILTNVKVIQDPGGWSVQPTLLGGRKEGKRGTGLSKLKQQQDQSPRGSHASSHYLLLASCFFLNFLLIK